MVKRSPSPTPPPITTSAKDTPSPSKKPKTVTLNDGDKAYLMEKAMDLAYKALPFKELSAELGIPGGRLKDQFKPNRANLRKAVEQVFEGESDGLSLRGDLGKRYLQSRVGQQ